MSQYYVPGPCQIYVGASGSAGYTFLGYSERQVDLSLPAAWEDVHSDMSGPAIAGDVEFLGETEARMSITLARFNYATLKRILTRPNTGGTTGAGASNVVGTLMLTENYMFPICIVLPYQAKSAYSALPPCYTFAAGYVPDDARFNLSVMTLKPTIMLRAIPVFNASDLSYTLYTNVKPVGLPSPD